MFRFCETCIGYCAYFLCSLTKNCFIKTTSSSYYLKLRPFIFKSFPNFANFSLMFLIDLFLIKRRVYLRRQNGIYSNEQPTCLNENGVDAK